MTYKESVQYIHSLLKFGIKPGLERISALADELGNPQNDMKFIHIAGTNGKGTTSTMMSQILKFAGYKTGLFTSPYVFDFCERIQINNQNILSDDLAEIVCEVKAAVENISKNGIEPTEFEVITATALLYFHRQKCDYVVLEVGLGGRYDSTNIIPPPCAAVITSVSLDHTKILGDTVEQIACEKCGIIKNGSNVITTSEQNPQALEIIMKTAKQKNAKLSVGNVKNVKILNEDIFGTDIEYDGLEIHIPLVGRHQVENAIGAVTAAKALKIKDEYIKSGIQNTVIHARMEIIEKEPPIMLDGGHNPECAEALASVLENFAGAYNITVLIGMMADKDCREYLKEILPFAKRCIVTAPDNPRSLGAEELKNLSKEYVNDVIICENPKEAYAIAKAEVTKKDMLLVCGSFYLISDIFNKYN